MTRYFVQIAAFGLALASCGKDSGSGSDTADGSGDDGADGSDGSADDGDADGADDGSVDDGGSGEGSTGSGGDDGADSASDTGGIDCPAADALVLAPSDAGLPAAFTGVFTRQVDVFGLRVFATDDTPDDKVVHAGHIYAQYLDNDEDCEIDDPNVHGALVDARAAIVMTANEQAFEQIPESVLESVWNEMALQPLYGSETFPGGHDQGQFDWALEEVLHIVTAVGYAQAYPSAFGEHAGTNLTDAMDIARGGHFQMIPNPYPDEAWYHYDDFTCDYGCMATEYIYWALTTLLGGQDIGDRCDEIVGEWELCTPADVETTDVAVHALLTDPAYSVPTVLPDGTYAP